MRWALIDRNPLETWVHPTYKICLLGDACHPMLVRVISRISTPASNPQCNTRQSQPYRAQGAAMAVEDAAVIGNLFSRVTSLKQVPSLLRAYQQLRHPRTSSMQIASRKNRGVFHFADGPAQEARDASMRASMEVEVQRLRGAKAETDVENANVWADRAKIRAQFGYDADAEVEKWRQSEEAMNTV
ncbi:hypothetical protein C0991_012388 [Blastosporella zonata]|nr:hypothetical protein C0991_012388 [Blastosporella zonata]